jgi:plastocyanin
MTRRNLLRAFGLFGGSVLLSGALSSCSLFQGLYGDKPNENPPPVETETVEIIEFSFRPAVIRIKKGTEVTWVQKDDTIHTVTSITPAGAFDSGELSQNQRFTFTFSELGSYDYYCVPHSFMRGKVIVE